MNILEKKATNNRYTERLNSVGATAQALGWRDKKQQELRFAVLADGCDLHGASVLDVGCGFGDFFDYLEACGVHVNYKGVDINPALLDVARTRHPNLPFEERDILEIPFEEPFDYVFESGVFNHKLEDNEGFARKMIAEMFRICRQGIAVNMTTSYVDYEEGHLHYFSPIDYFDFAKQLTRFVTIRHDYPLFEFTLYLYKRN